MVALSPSFHCKIPNRAKRIAKLNNSPIILPDLQGQALPPCCSTRKSEQTAPRRRVIPKGSMLYNLVRMSSLWLEVSIFPSLKDETTRTRIATPKGTFLELKRSASYHFDRIREKVTSKNTTSSLSENTVHLPESVLRKH